MPDAVSPLRDASLTAMPLRAGLVLRRLIWPLALRLAVRLRLLAPPPGDAGGGVPVGRALALRGRLRHGLPRRRRREAVARLRRFPGFSGSAYVTLNPDLRWLVRNPASHALFHGACAGRTLFRPERLARALGEVRAPAAVGEPPADLAALCARAGRVGILVSSHGNVFMQDIADDLAADLAATGIAVERMDEHAAPHCRPPLSIVVAPHEFFVLGAGRGWIRADVLTEAVMLNTEQAQTRWFALALPFMLAARGVIDLNAQMCGLFAAAGLPALQITPASPHAGAVLDAADRRHPLFRVLPAAARRDPDPAAPFADRPLDIAFFGAATAQRSAFFARHAGFFAGCESFLYCRPQARGPIRGDGADGALSRIARHVGGHARITLNLHRDEFGYFEWHRVVRLGLSMGSVVVSEPSQPHPALHAGVHFFEAPSRQIPELIEWLLRTPDGRRAAAAAQEAARRTLGQTFAPARNGARLLQFLLDGARTA